jgi:phytoene dehydrogenase-like protein
MFLSGDALKRKYPVIVLGAGYGGLSAAASFAREDYETLLIPFSGSKAENRSEHLLAELAPPRYLVDFPARQGSSGLPRFREEADLPCSLVKKAVLAEFPLPRGTVFWGTDRYETLAGLADNLPNAVKGIQQLFRVLEDLCLDVAALSAAESAEALRRSLPGCLLARGRVAAVSRLNMARLVRRYFLNRKFMAWLDGLLLHETHMTAEQCPALLGALAVLGPAVFRTYELQLSAAGLLDHLYDILKTPGIAFCPEARVRELILDSDSFLGVLLEDGRHVRGDYAVVDREGLTDLVRLFPDESSRQTARRLQPAGEPVVFRQSVPPTGETPAEDGIPRILVGGSKCTVRESRDGVLREHVYLAEETVGAVPVRLPLGRSSHGEMFVWENFGDGLGLQPWRNLVVLPGGGFYRRRLPWNHLQGLAAVRRLLHKADQSSSRLQSFWRTVVGSTFSR